MRTVNFRDDIIWPVVSRMGYDPSQDLIKDFADALARYVNAWVRKCWEIVDWPELSKIEQRTPVNHLVPYDAGTVPPPTWVITDSYNLDSVVRDPAATTDVYVSIQNANTGHALSDTAWWTKLSNWDPNGKYALNAKVVDPVSGIVFVAQTTITPSTAISDSLQNPIAWRPLYSQEQPTQQITDIGKVLKVYLVDPRTNDGPFDVPFRLQDTDVHVGYDHGNTVWIKFMPRPSRYTLTAWISSATYASGGLAYDPDSGNCFISLQSNNINHSVTNTAWWKLIPFPYVLADCVWHGVYADALREDGQTQKALAEEQSALAELQLSIKRNLFDRYDTLTDQQTGVPRSVAQPVATAA